MKKLLVLSVLVSQGCFSQVQSDEINCLKPPVSTGFVVANELLPRNVSWVNKEYGAVRTEVSILDYYLFLSFLRYEPGGFKDPVSGEKLTLKTCFPDLGEVEGKVQPLWKALIAGLSDSLHQEAATEIMADFFSKIKVKVPLKLDPKQRELAAFPVTGISYEAATKYAGWLSYMYRTYFSEEEKYSWEFQLPTEDQWEELANAGLGEKMRQNQVLDSVNAEGCFLFNYANLPDCKSMPGYLKSSRGGGAAPVSSFNADFIGLHNVFGNVAEMIATKGICKGGSYEHKPYQAKIPVEIRYSGPKPWLGMRLIAIPVSIR